MTYVRTLVSFNYLYIIVSMYPCIMKLSLKYEITEFESKSLSNTGIHDFVYKMN